MNQRNMHALAVLLFFCATVLFSSGCTKEEVIETSELVSTTAVKLLAVSPPQALPFLVLIGAIAGAVGATTSAITQFRKARKMKGAIMAKSEQIDKVILATKGKDNPEKSPVLDFLKADMRLADADRKKALNEFDNIRKGLK